MEILSLLKNEYIEKNVQEIENYIIENYNKILQD